MPSRFLRLPTPSHAGSAGHAIEDHAPRVIFYGERRVLGVLTTQPTFETYTN